MKALSIAAHSLVEASRSGVFLTILIVMMIILASTLSFTYLEESIQERITIDINLLLMTLFGLTLTLVGQSDSLPRERERNTLIFILTQPVSRYSFILGKYLGNLFLLFVSLFIMTVEQALLMKTVFGTKAGIIFSISFSLFLKLAMIGAVAILFSVFTTRVITVSVSLFAFLVGHFVSFVDYVISLLHSTPLEFFFHVLRLLIPDYSSMSIYMVHNFSLKTVLPHLAISSLYSLFYSLVMLELAHFIFSRKDL